MIGGLAEDGTDTGEVEGPGGGDDEEDGKEVGGTPDDLVGHPRDPVALMFHVPEGQAADAGHDRQERQQTPVTLGGQVPFAVNDSLHVQ